MQEKTNCKLASLNVLITQREHSDLVPSLFEGVEYTSYISAEK